MIKDPNFKRIMVLVVDHLIEQLDKILDKFLFDKKMDILGIFEVAEVFDRLNHLLAIN